MKVKAAEAGNQELAETLLAEGAILGAGALPDTEAATEEGKKAVLESLTAASTAVLKEKKTKKEKSEKAEKAEPKTLAELGVPMIWFRTWFRSHHCLNDSLGWFSIAKKSKKHFSSWGSHAMIWFPISWKPSLFCSNGSLGIQKTLLELGVPCNDLISNFMEAITVLFKWFIGMVFNRHITYWFLLYHTPLDRYHIPLDLYICKIYIILLYKRYMQDICKIYIILYSFLYLWV